jgi:type IX secretion system PorP/SprF family membrane protein
LDFPLNSRNITYIFGKVFAVASGMTFKKLFSTLLLGACVSMVHAQDPQFSQFYANPLYLSPAFAGGDLAPRITLNYRNQWPGLAANYTTTSFGIDHYFANVNSGVGLLVMNDSQGTGNLRTTDIAAQYAYQLRLTENTAIRMGLQGSYSMRTADLSALTFPDQYTNRGFTGNPTLDPVALNGTPRVGYMSFATGLLLYSDRYWAGVSAHHINRPEQGFFQVADGTRLPIKGSFHAGLRIPFGGFTGLGDEWDREKTISPAIMYKFQGKFDQLDLGVYLTYSPIVLGLWYRGLPIKKYAPNISNRESIIALVGYRQDRFSFGYSYDLTISALGLPSGGSHEISLAYTFEWEPITRQKRIKKDKQLSCPKF